MFSEAYIIFSLGLTKPLQKAMFPSCFSSHADCSTQLTHVQNYIQLCGIIVGESLLAGPMSFLALGRGLGQQLGEQL